MRIPMALAALIILIYSCRTATHGHVPPVGTPQDSGSGPREDGGCQPNTCQLEAAACGQVPDGCGGVLDCGTCDAGSQTCGAKVQNTCGWTPGTTKRVWMPGGNSEGVLKQLAWAPDGGFVLWAFAGTSSTYDGVQVQGVSSVLAQYPGDGSNGWTHILKGGVPAGAQPFAADGQGNVQMPWEDGIITSFAATTGEVRWSFPPTGQLLALASAVDGTTAIATFPPPFSDTNPQVQVVDASGNPLWSHPVVACAMAFTSENALVLATCSGEPDLLGVDSHGNLLWSLLLTGLDSSAAFASIAIGTNGDIFVAGTASSGSGSWGAASVQAPGAFLVAADSAGNALWAASLSGAVGAVPVLAADEHGGVASTVAVRDTSSTLCRRTTLANWDARGTPRWSRTILETTCNADPNNSVSLETLTVIGDEIHALGTFNGTVDFGTGPVTGIWTAVDVVVAR